MGDERDREDPTTEVDRVAFIRHEASNVLCSLSAFTRHRMTLVLRAVDDGEENVIVSTDADLLAVVQALLKENKRING